MSILVISPHLDDAVFSCGLNLAAAAAQSRPITILTVCSGLPWHGFTTPYDEGFASSRAAMLWRRHEDQHACEELGASPVWTDLLDNQYRKRDDGEYGQPATPGEVEACLAVAWQRAIGERSGGMEGLQVAPPDELWIPLGLNHPDHVAVAAGAEAWSERLRAESWAKNTPLRRLVYSDQPYAGLNPELEERIARRRALTYDAERSHLGVPSLQVRERHRRALSYYLSQQRDSEEAPHVFRAARFWKLP